MSDTFTITVEGKKYKVTDRGTQWVCKTDRFSIRISLSDPLHSSTYRALKRDAVHETQRVSNALIAKAREAL